MAHGGKGGGNELLSPVLNGGNIGKYQEAVGSFAEENETQYNGGDPQSSIGLFLFLPFFMNSVALTVVFVVILLGVGIISIDV